ncbi:hypothetical protein [Magnetospirillum molischianum]|uniref:Uncharacterized protein n=1 Tax=Magnetospirillum molischianum DSM 120 TaxID=1150626 RepID=H8FYD9_MAGML|nr:hypothetical protein [Magnetospirillum molischianum]CCG43377.1 hypothetical protein PHAMO_80168 [Magnetospirillum molischianum DSM 120]
MSADLNHELIKLVTAKMTAGQKARLAERANAPAVHFGPGTEAWQKAQTQLARRVGNLALFRMERPLTLDMRQAAAVRRKIDQAIEHLRIAERLMQTAHEEAKSRNG